MIFSKRPFKRIATISIFAAILSGCVTGAQEAQELPLIKHNYSTKKTLAYNHFGFNFDSVPRGIYNILDEKPTEFTINIYIADNQSCKFVYTKNDKGDTEQVTKTESVKGYLSGENVLLKLDCKGKESNIDYKVIAYANGVEYDRIGNLSYLVESGEI